EDRVRVNLGDWTLDAPKAGSFEPLRVRFSKSLDHKALERFLTVRDGKGAPVAGTMATGAHEKSWTFLPARRWENQAYRLLVNERLEDIAGNTLLRPFDLDLQAPMPPPQAPALRFQPRP